MEPVDDSTGLEVELGGQLFNGFRGGIGFLLVGLFQSFLLLGPQNHPGLLQLLLSRALGTLDVIWPHKSSIHRMAGMPVTQGAQSPLHVSWRHKKKKKRGLTLVPRNNMSAPQLDHHNCNN